MEKVQFGILVGCLVGIFVLADCVSLALSVAAAVKTEGTQANSPVYATIVSGVMTGVTFFTLLVVTLPACICCPKGDKDAVNCCAPTYYVSVIVAGAISVIGTSVVGILQVFSVSTYEEILSGSEATSLLYAAGVLNLIATAYGIAMIVFTFISCWNDGRWRAEPTPSSSLSSLPSLSPPPIPCCDCSKENVCALTLIKILMVSSLVAFLLTTFNASLVADYSDGSTSSTYALFAAMFSMGAATFLLFGLCIGGSLICCPCIGHTDRAKIMGIVVCVWALLAAGTIIGGALMMAAGSRIVSEDSDTTDAPLNRGSLSAMAYLAGGLNFMTTLIAVIHLYFGYKLCRSNREEGSSGSSV